MICHIDADSFFASVLIRKYPSLQGKPVIAVGMGGSCVIAATYDVKAKGVRTGMRLKEARKLCPGAIEVPSDFKETALASRQIEDVLTSFCPTIEQMSIDEWYLDLHSICGGVPFDLLSWAQGTRQLIVKRTAFSVSVGIAPTKLLAKMSSEYRKPGGVTVLTDQNLHAFLCDRPAAAIPGIGPRRQDVVRAHGWHTAWDIAHAADDALRSLLGRSGLEIKQELLGERVHYVSSYVRLPQSISRCRSFRSTTDVLFLRAQLLKHLEYCIFKMRRFHLITREVCLLVRTHEYHSRSAYVRSADSWCTVEEVLPSVLHLFQDLCFPLQSYTQLGLTLSQFSSANEQQLSLFTDKEYVRKSEHVQAACDAITRRFGRNVLTRASALQVSTGTELGLDFSLYQ